MGIEKVVGNGDWGGKGNWIKVAAEAGLRVPKTAVITTDLFDALKCRGNVEEGWKKAGNRFDRELTDIIEMFEGKPIAIRSSATSEDGLEFTSAGMYTTEFVRYHVARKYMQQNLGHFKVWALSRVLSSVWDKNAAAYRKKHRMGTPRMAVLIQEVVGRRFSFNIPRYDLVYGGIAPYYAGYFNTMFENRAILGVVNGLGTEAVLGMDSPVFHFSPEGQVLESNPEQFRMRYFDEARGSFTTDTTRKWVISESDAKKMHMDMAAMAEAFIKAGNIPDGHGIDLEFAYQSSIDEPPFFLQGRPVRKRKGVIAAPEGMKRIFYPRSLYGYGACSFETVVDLTFNYFNMECTGFKALERFNRQHKGYLLVLPNFVFSRTRSTADIAEAHLQYRHFNNAGGVIALGEAGVGLTGAGHFALVCHDDGMLFMDGRLSEEVKQYLDLKEPRASMRLRKLQREATMFVDGNMNRGGLYIRA